MELLSPHKLAEIRPRHSSEMVPDIRMRVAILEVIELRGRCPKGQLSMGVTGIGVAVPGVRGRLIDRSCPRGKCPQSVCLGESCLKTVKFLDINVQSITMMKIVLNSLSLIDKTSHMVR